MKNMNIKWTLLLAAMFSFAACDTDVEYDIPEVEAPVLVSTTPEANAAKVKRGEITIEVKYDKNVFFATKDLDKISFTGGTLISADVYGSSNVLTLTVNVPERETLCTLSIPEGVVLGPNKMPAPAVSLQFTTIALDKTPVMAVSTNAVKLYDYLLANYDKKVLSGMMAKESWNTDMAERVYEWTGKYPALNTFDYGHLAWSLAGANWINYGDITPVKNWADNHGIVSCMWHWNVPKFAPLEESIAATVWEGEKSTGNWAESIDLRKSEGFDTSVFDNAKAGDYIIVKVKDLDAAVGWWQGSVKNASWTDLVTGSGVVELTSAQTSYVVRLTEDALNEVKENGLVISGCNHTVTGVYIGTPATVYDLGTDYTYKPDETTFDAANATVEGTWENKVFTSDMAAVAGYLKLLKDAGIPVLWRPFHEAAGKWFWWGKDAASHKAMWIAMFNYFKAQGLDNLIWVWTTETGDEDWYPGDQYVDIIGRDIYSKDAETCASQYAAISATYGNKMITLSECGTVGKISEQWAAGARWSWFMPWYDGEEEDGTPIVHADEAWWKDAMEQSYVITRDEVPSME